MNPERFDGLPKESREGDKHTADFEGHILDVYKLIDLANELPNETVDTKELESAKGGKYWKDSQDNWLGPEDILSAYQQNPEWEELKKVRPEWQKELEKIIQADYKAYPIILIQNTVVDGMHRLTKAWIDGVRELEIKRFKELPKEAIMNNT